MELEVSCGVLSFMLESDGALSLMLRLVSSRLGFVPTVLGHTDVKRFGMPDFHMSVRSTGSVIGR